MCCTSSRPTYSPAKTPLELENPPGPSLLDACVAELRESGVPVSGELLRSYGTHTDVAAQILRRADDLHAGAIVLGADTRHPALTNAVTAYITAHAPTHVIVINPDAGALGRLHPDTAVIRNTPAKASAIPPQLKCPAEIVSTPMPCRRGRAAGKARR